ncbi:BolA family transcriptional regulator [Leptospira gomenensis]|uniref:BolA family transcriptional regulator n=1 Tax=Leptospira gomenensis TaxID=2484974 RepID=A0A5F1YSV9_9LEPT|nr:BolA family protein [Leptospira gomenensis]TGK35329.1 BolA family transcriptional regulator [Leptospira gomenensis]TGK35894.1 BolA family transcriptional regulator [Leptospira gomenensis]TGK44033.1 BolA family transcriptional regulator [Leptospira gomenensis]TGK61319.1 BolA family transcriptional regulator [Leptospira gomenensis]
MSVQEGILRLLKTELLPSSIEVYDYSSEHAGHSGNPGHKLEGTHIRITVVSGLFSGKSKVEQHRMVYDLLRPWITSGLHAITLETSEPV